MPLLKPGDTSAVATIQYIDPFEDPTSYGVDLLQLQLRDVHPASKDVESAAAALRAAAARNDVAAVHRFTKSILSLLRDDPPYEVLSSGKDTVAVPVLVAAAPQVPDASVKAGWSRADVISGELEIKVAGTGLSANAKVIVEDLYEIESGPGEIQVLLVLVPILWEVRLTHKYYEPFRELHAIPMKVNTKLPAEVQLWQHLGKVLPIEQQDLDLMEAGRKPFRIGRSWPVESSLGFGVGFKAAGLDTTLTVTRQHTVTVDLSASLPRGHAYTISWLGGPLGVQVTADPPK